MSRWIAALVMQTVTCVPGTYRKVEGENQLYKAVLWSSHMRFIFYVNYTCIIDLYRKCLLYNICEHVFGIPYFAFSGFYFMYGFLIFTE